MAKRININAPTFSGDIDGVRVSIMYGRVSGYVDLRADRVVRRGSKRWTVPRTLRIRPTDLPEFLGGAIDGWVKKGGK